MRNRFVKTSNVMAFMAGVERVKARGAVEASWQLAEGVPGLGKTRTLTWWAAKNEYVLVRAKKGWTVNWALRDLMSQLGEPPARSTEVMLNAAIASISVSGRALIVDEVEHAMAGGIIEVLRDISDFTESPIIIGGMQGVAARLKRYPQIYSRIADVTVFKPATLADVKLCCDELADVPIAEDLVKAIHAQTGGRFREVMNAIAFAERAGRRANGPVTLEHISAKDLTNDRRPEARAANAKAS
ncbi:ATP-binding protein [Pyruvatibacter sp.]|uniref:ATP-binding protein n=1 Tax=Pyruvatibacter sp. TaxID=1981328 RepID=UPI0032F078D8